MSKDKMLKISSYLFFLASMLFLVATITSGNNTYIPFVAVFIVLGSAFTVLSNKEKDSAESDQP